MKRIAWDPEKSEKLRSQRGASFDEIVRGRLVDIISHPTRADQQMLVYERNGYCWAVPCVVREESFFLKTAYPSRKMTRKYLRKEMP